MDKLINFFLQAGKLKKMKQKGWVLREVEKPTTVAAHCFRENLMAWLFSQKRPKLDQSKLFKLALLHDLVAGYAGDVTPYDPFFADGQSPKKEVFEKWVTLSKQKKEEFFKKKTAKERKALKSLSAYLPPAIKKETDQLWKEYERRDSPEARFVHQVDMLEIFLQALQYWKQDHSFPIKSWWQQMKELIDDPHLLQFLKALEKQFHQP